jgi:hypothetical protein
MKNTRLPDREAVLLAAGLSTFLSAVGEPEKLAGIVTEKGPTMGGFCNPADDLRAPDFAD